MKKRILLVWMAVAMLLVLSGCACEHQWVDANCLTPKTCSLCEETEGEPLGHDWLPAECTLPERCSRCDETVGEPLGHTWVDADCVTPKTCSVCAETEGEALGHTWVEATCVLPKTCSVCAETEGEALGHTWEEATCVLPKTCSVCEETEGEALGHTWAEATCVLPKTCSVCAETEGEALGHTWVDATCVLPKTCSVCAETEGEALGHTWVEATCVLPKTCSMCAETEGEALGHTWVEATCAKPETCSVCGETQGETLPHSYSKLIVVDDIMGRVCTVCFNEELVPLDYDVFLQDNLSGEWFAITGLYEEQVLMLRAGVPEEHVGMYLNFMEDHQVQLYCEDLDPDYQLCTWVLKEESLTDEYPGYILEIASEDDSWAFWFTIEDGYPVITSPGVGSFDACNMFRYEYPELAKALSQYQWVGFDESMAINLIRFYEDYTFTGYHDGQEVAGNWHLRDVYTTEYGGVYGNVVFSYQKDGQPCLVPLRVYFSSSDGVIETAVEHVYAIETFDYSNRIRYQYNQDDQDLTVADLERMQAELPKKLAGTWTSVSSDDYSGDNTVSVSTTDYTITLLEDGTYTTNEELADFFGWSTEGTWEITSVNAGYDMTLDADLNLISSNGTKNNGYFQMGELSVYSGELHAQFVMISDEERAKLEEAAAGAKDLLLGDWTSTVVTNYNDVKADISFCPDYTFSFLADDTLVINDAFAALLGKETTGTWSIGEVNLEEYSQTGFSISGRLQFTDGDSLYYYQSNDEISISTEYSSIDFKKLTQEEIDALLKGEEALIGEWTSVIVTKGEEQVEDTTYHLSISADGTFTANEPLAAVMETTTGKWALADYENGCYVYSFVMEDTGYWYNYEILPTGELNAWGWLADDEWIDVVLVKDE